MGIVRKRNITAGVLLSLLFVFKITSGQTFSFKTYGEESSLPDTYIYTILQEDNGFLWIGTGRGLVKFDGFSFHPVVYPDSISDRYVSSGFKDRNGRLWFGCNDGSLFYTEGNSLVKMSGVNMQSISDIVQGSDGRIFIIPQSRTIIEIDPDNPDEYVSFIVPGNIIMSTACFTGENNLLLGTQENLLYCDLAEDSLSIKSVIEGIEYSKVQSIRPFGTSGIYLIGTEGMGLFKLTMNNENPVLERFEQHPELDYLDVKMITEDDDKNIWLSTYGSGILELMLAEDGTEILSKTSFNTTNGLAGDNVRNLFQDMEGNIWIGLYGEGLSVLVSEAFSFFAPGENPEENGIIYININETGDSYFLGTSRGYYTFDLDKGKAGPLVNLSSRIGQNEISVFCLDGNDLWLGTKGNGVYHVERRSGSAQLFYRSGNTGEDYIKHIASDKTKIWLGTLNGVVVLNKASGEVIHRYRIADRLPHNSINQVFIRRNGDAIIATECDRLYTINVDRGVSVDERIMSGMTKNKVLCFSESDDGGIWAGTEGNGVFFISDDSVLNITTANGLISNYCYSILADSRGKVWIGHERGISVFDTSTGSVRAYSNEFAKGGNCNQNAILETGNGYVLIGTTEGIIAYNSSKDRRKVVAPLNNILSITINNVSYPLQASYSLPYNKYNIVIEYVGINLNEPNKVYYSTKLDNWDDDWSPLTSSRRVTYQLKDGRYRFNLMSVNESGISQDVPVAFDIFIKKPFWRSWWFILCVVIVMTGIVMLIIREREKAHKKINDYLESELAARTRLVMQQKDEIEAQNVEITDSINYAKRIQSSILPDINKLKDAFADAFVIFHPRDIVSGDFYWFDRLDESRFIVVCADSTGHGVPGAFMSMIGSTLLQDIIARKGITRPSQILTLLDEQIFSTLNQNVDVGVSNDGMDMVVFEVNLSTRHIRFASAMRPVIIVMGGESYYIKGNRCSVGGESVIEKYYDDQEYYLNNGDSVYLFSDGLPDQFGGEDGKKLKINRLKNLIEDVHKLPMDEQKEIISKFFYDWKGDYEQVDDVILMGLRL